MKLELDRIKRNVQDIRDVQHRLGLPNESDITRVMNEAVNIIQWLTGVKFEGGTPFKRITEIDVPDFSI